MSECDRCELCRQPIANVYDTDERRILFYQPYGGLADTEPPADRLLHRACWDRLPAREKRIVDLSAWAASRAIREWSSAERPSGPCEFCRESFSRSAWGDRLPVPDGYGHWAHEECIGIDIGERGIWNEQFRGIS